MKNGSHCNKLVVRTPLQTHRRDDGGYDFSDSTGDEGRSCLWDIFGDKTNSAS